MIQGRMIMQDDGGWLVGDTDKDYDYNSHDDMHSHTGLEWSEGLCHWSQSIS